jgi:hypothetical protein
MDMRILVAILATVAVVFGLIGVRMVFTRRFAGVNLKNQISLTKGTLPKGYTSVRPMPEDKFPEVEQGDDDAVIVEHEDAEEAKRPEAIPFVIAFLALAACCIIQWTLVGSGSDPAQAKELATFKETMKAHKLPEDPEKLKEELKDKTLAITAITLPAPQQPATVPPPAGDKADIEGETDYVKMLFKTLDIPEMTTEFDVHKIGTNGRVFTIPLNTHHEWHKAWVARAQKEIDYSDKGPVIKEITSAKFFVDGGRFRTVTVFYSGTSATREPISNAPYSFRLDWSREDSQDIAYRLDNRLLNFKGAKPPQEPKGGPSLPLPVKVPPPMTDPAIPDPKPADPKKK